MRRFKEAALSVLVGLLSWVLGFLAFYPFGYLVGEVAYPALCKWAPRFFRVYNQVLEPEAFERVNGNINLIAALFAIFAISYLTVRYDNRRYEVMITETEGLYTVREGAALYYPRFLRVDLLSSMVMAIPLAVLPLFLPEEMPKILRRITETLTAMTWVFTDRFGIILGTLVLALLIFVFRQLSGLIALGRWRALWLSDIDPE